MGLPAQLDARHRAPRLAVLVLLGLTISSGSLLAEERSQQTVLIVIGPSNHPPGTHEVAAGGRLLAHCLNHAENVPDLEAIVSEGWPEDPELLHRASTIVFLGDTFPGERLPDSESVMTQLGSEMNRGCGIVCIHYATGLRAEDVAPDGDHPLLHWTGGYFATRCKHHQSIAKIFKATIEPAAPGHPVMNGWNAFTLTDEPYIKNYFGPDGLAANVVPLATSMLPPEDPHREVVAWGTERPDGGRGVGIVMPHFYRSWLVDDLRTLILNGVVWTTGANVPESGVASPPPRLEEFSPGALAPQKRR